MLRNKDIISSRDYLFLNAFIIFVPIILYPLITEKISTEQYGNYIFLQSVAFLFVGISNFGCLVGYKRNFFKYRNNKKKGQILLVSIESFIFIIFSFLFLINFFLNNYIFERINMSPDEYNYWLFLLSAIMLDIFNKYYLTYLVNKKESKKYSFLVFIKFFIYLVIATILILNGNKILALIYALFISNLILFFLILFLQFRSFKFEVNLNYIMDILKISYPLTFRIFFGQVNVRLDKILITLISSASSTGIYTIAQSIAYFIFQLMTALDKVFITGINNMLFNKNNRNVGKYLTPFFYISGIPAIFLILFHDVIFKIFINEAYYGSENIVIILSVYYFFLFFSKISGTQLVYFKKTWLAGNIFLVNLFLNFIFGIPLILSMGIEGAALSTLASSIVSIIMQYYFANKYVPFRYEFNKVLSVSLFILIISSYQFLIINSYIDINIYFEISVSTMLIIIYFIIGYKFNIYDQKTLIKFFNYK
jgi:O-antigen/teichoic acid export membrane protein